MAIHACGRIFRKIGMRFGGIKCKGSQSGEDGEYHQNREAPGWWRHQSTKKVSGHKDLGLTKEIKYFYAKIYIFQYKNNGYKKIRPGNRVDFRA